MTTSARSTARARFVAAPVLALLGPLASAQLTDVTQAPNPIGAGIQKSFDEQVSAGRGDIFTPGSSIFLIRRDPFRAIARGRQLFQRKFTLAQGVGPRTNDGIGDISLDGSIGAGLADSCAACHSRPFGSAGFGGNVITRPKSRDAPHLFGLGLQEMLADEITADLRAIRATALQLAQLTGSPVSLPLVSKLINYGTITAMPNGTFDTSAVEGVDPDLRVRPFFAEGSTISIREFLVGAFNAEMGLEAPDTDLEKASGGKDVRTPSGMVLSGSQDAIEAPPASGVHDDPDGDGVMNEIPLAAVDLMEFYLLNYFPPAKVEFSPQVNQGAVVFNLIGCGACHIVNLPLNSDRRLAHVETVFDPVNANNVYNSLAATATPQFNEFDDGSGFPTIKRPIKAPTVVENFYGDMKRHDLGPGFWERNYDGTITKEFMTEPLWGVGSTPPYGHDGRSATLVDVILRHGGDAQVPRDKFVALSTLEQRQMIAFLRSLVLFSPEDTPSNLNPADPMDPMFPIEGQGSISLAPLFNDPSEGE